MRDTWSELAQFGTGSTYLNFSGLLDERPEAGVDDASGQNLWRLADLKATYDPENVFRANNNILPAPRSGRGH